MEASAPSNRVVYFDCGCSARAAEQKAAADRKELERRNAIAPPHLPVESSEDRLRDEVAALTKRLAALEHK
jgi:hypothetical protein